MTDLIKNFLFAVLLVIVLPCPGLGQQFSQYSLMPLPLNPAQVAITDKASLMLIHRQQQYAYHTSLQHMAVAGSYPLFRQESGQPRGGLGLSFLSSYSDDIQFFRKQQAHAAFAYRFTINPQTFLSWGIQTGYMQQSFSTDGITTGSQYTDNLGYNPQLAIREDLPYTRNSSLKTGSGLHLYTVRKGMVAAYAGLSLEQSTLLHHMYGQAADYFPRRWVVYGGKRIAYQHAWSFTPELLWATEAGQQWMRAGGRCSYYFENHNPLDPLQTGSVDFSVQYAVRQAVVLAVQFHQPHYSFGISYDIPADAMYPLQGATELGVSFVRPIRRRKAVVAASHTATPPARYFPEKQAASGRKMAGGRGTAEDKLPVRPDTAQLVQKDSVVLLKKTFQFQFNDTTLTAEIKAYFDDFVSLMQLNPDFKVRIVGHTDNVGDAQTNRRLSLSRAQAIRAYMEQKGVDSRRMVAEGRGAADPAYPNDTPASRAANRRVELFIYK